MKKIDKLLLTSFVGPFAVSFGIALFVLVMQFLWLYIDDIAGKGISIFILLELIGYMSISIFPMALPIAVLIASVMVMGNLAERYELSSMKSAGVSLLRILRSLVVVSVGVAFFSYICSDFLIPVAMLKFKSRLYDVRKQKPALTLEKGVFNEDFRQFVIRIGDKARDGETIQNVLIEDQTNFGKLKFNQILADSGQMFTTADKRFFVMNLFDGAQYQEPSPQGSASNKGYPFVRTNFRSWTKVWDLGEFEMTRTDEDRFKSQRSMLSMNQLRKGIDSLYREIDTTRVEMATELMANLNRPLRRPDPPPRYTAAPDTTQLRGFAAKLKPKIKNPKWAAPPQAGVNTPGGPEVPRQALEKNLREYQSLVETFESKGREKLLRDAVNQATAGKLIVERRAAQIENRRKEAVKSGYELFSKYSFAAVCFVFLFVGAPMGAIIRKGGFGYPILVSIVFFVVFIMLSILCKKLAEAYVLPPFWAAMTPCIVLMVIGSYLTGRAMKDAQMFSTDRLDRLMLQLRRRFEKQV
ncbi:MAG: LptF/LptG family permease [Saprospiraceae bacterium]|nr:LptF/LptG family permease [Saprospiraceae bacterium]